MKAKITLGNIKGYLQAHYRQLLDEMDYLPEHIKQQAEWRLNRVKEKSPECYNSNKCVHCGCEVSSKVFEDRGCEGSCYPEMMNEDDWNNHERLEFSPIIILDMSKEETLADLMQNNQHLTKEELLYWLPQFKDK